jgi:hypothetical protein
MPVLAASPVCTAKAGLWGCVSDGRPRYHPPSRGVRLGQRLPPEPVQASRSAPGALYPEVALHEVRSCGFAFGEREGAPGEPDWPEDPQSARRRRIRPGPFRPGAGPWRGPGRRDGLKIGFENGTNPAPDGLGFRLDSLDGLGESRFIASNRPRTSHVSSTASGRPSSSPSLTPCRKGTL